MGAFQGWLAVGGGIADGVLTESPAVPRVAVTADLTGTTVTFPAGATLGPFQAGGGPFIAWGLFDAASGGAMSAVALMAPLTVMPGQYLTFPGGPYTVAAPPPAPGTDVMTVGGEPVTLLGLPLQVA